MRQALADFYHPELSLNPKFTVPDSDWNSRDEAFARANFIGRQVFVRA